MRGNQILLIFSQQGMFFILCLILKNALSVGRILQTGSFITHLPPVRHPVLQRLRAKATFPHFLWKSSACDWWESLESVIWMGPSTVAENLVPPAAMKVPMSGSLSWVLSAWQVEVFFLPNNPVEELEFLYSGGQGREEPETCLVNSQAPVVSHERSGRPGEGPRQWCSHKNHCGLYALGMSQRMSEWRHDNYWGLDKSVLRGTFWWSSG